MAFIWTVTGVLGVVVAAAGFAFALAVWRASPARRQNRLLALCLALEATYWGAAAGWGGLSDSRDVVYAAFALHTYAVAAYAATYILFVGTLDTPLAWPFRGTVGLVSAGGLVVGMWTAFTLWPQLFIEGIVPRGYGRALIYQEGPATLGFLVFSVLAVLYSVAVAVSAYRRAAPGSAARGRARLLAVAFGVRDALLAFYLVVFRLLHLQDGHAFWQAADHVVGVAVPVVGMTLLSYGILHSQVLDIDLRLKAGIARTTVAGAFAAAFFVGSELLEGVLPVQGAWLGLLAAGAVALALRPLHRAALRISDAVLPHARPTPEYLANRKGDVYSAAYESALESGGVSEKERATLDRLAAKLALTREEARALEAEAERRLRWVPSGPASLATRG